MKKKINLKINTKVNIFRFNEFRLSVNDVNPPIKITKKRYRYPKTTSSYINND